MADALTSLEPGDVVSGLEPAELVEIQKLTPFGGKTLVEGVGVQSRRLVRRPLSSEELTRLVRVRGSSFTHDGDAQSFLLGAEAERIRIAYQFDPLFAVNASVVDPLPHQVEAVYCSLLPLPRSRFVLADDPRRRQDHDDGAAHQRTAFSRRDPDDSHQHAGRSDGKANVV